MGLIDIPYLGRGDHRVDGGDALVAVTHGTHGRHVAAAHAGVRRGGDEYLAPFAGAGGDVRCRVGVETLVKAGARLAEQCAADLVAEGVLYALYGQGVVHVYAVLQKSYRVNIDGLDEGQQHAQVQLRFFAFGLTESVAAVNGVAVHRDGENVVVGALQHGHDGLVFRGNDGARVYPAL